MAIYDPTPFLTSTDRRLLILLSKLILDAEGVEYASNRAVDSVDLTLDESRELLELLEQFISSRRFQESAYLLETLFSGKSFESRHLRDIFLRWRKFHGKSRALATDQWEMFLSRLGIAPRRYGSAPWYRRDAIPMPLDHFLRMERKLAAASGISPRVQELLLSYVQRQFHYLQELRHESARLQPGQISNKPNAIVSILRQNRNSRIGVPPLSTTKIAATMTIVMDLGAVYTTRDWSVAGFLSTLAGAAPHAMLD